MSSRRGDTNNSRTKQQQSQRQKPLGLALVEPRVERLSKSLAGSEDAPESIDLRGCLILVVSG